MSSNTILVARQSFSTEIDGAPRSIKKGETFRQGHPVIEGREHLFKPFTIDNEIEQATAAPGEKRTKRPRAKKEAKKTEKPVTAPPAEQNATETNAANDEEESAEATVAPGENEAGAEQTSDDSDSAANSTD